MSGYKFIKIFEHPL